MIIANPSQPSSDRLALLYRRPLTPCDARFSMRQSVMALLRLRALSRLSGRTPGPHRGQRGPLPGFHPRLPPSVGRSPRSVAAH